MPEIKDVAHLVNGFSGKGEGLESEEEKSEINWRTHDYVTRDRKGFCCFNPKISLTIPLTDRITWEKNIKEIIGPAAIETSFLEDEKEQILTEILKNTLKATTIPERIIEAKDNFDYKFLDPFLDCYDPRKFTKKYLKLEDPKCRKLFLKIIGGENALNIVKESEIIELIKKIESIPISCNSEEIKIFDDKILELKAQNKVKEVRDVFRYFRSEKMFRKKGFIFFNNRSSKLPSVLSADEGEEFLQWLQKKIISKITEEKEAVNFILYCLTFNVFYFANEIFHNKFKSFFDSNLETPKLKLDSSAPTRFIINKVLTMKGERDEIYEAGQEKPFSLRTFIGDSEIHLAKMYVGLYFQIRNNEIFSSKIYIKDIVFCEDIKLKDKKDILEKIYHYLKK